MQGEYIKSRRQLPACPRFSDHRNMCMHMITPEILQIQLTPIYRHKSITLIQLQRRTIESRIKIEDDLLLIS